MNKKIYIAVFALVIFVLPYQVGFAQTATSTASIEELQTLIQTLQAQVTALQAQIATLNIGNVQTITDSSVLVIPDNNPISRGSVGSVVSEVQKALKDLPDIYPEGLVTGYLGPLTEAAIKRFQEQHSIEATGEVDGETLSRIRREASTRKANPPSGTTTAVPAIPGRGATSTVPATPAVPANRETSVTTTTPPTATSTDPASNRNNYLPIGTTIIVSSPNGGEQWLKGTTHSIHWSFNSPEAPGATNVNILISSAEGNVRRNVYTISDIPTVLGNNQYSLFVPETIVSASNYRITIEAERQVYNTVRNGWTYPGDESDGNIAIIDTYNSSGSSSSGSIPVTQIQGSTPTASTTVSVENATTTQASSGGSTTGYLPNNTTVVVSNPNGGESLQREVPYVIRWQVNAGTSTDSFVTSILLQSASNNVRQTVSTITSSAQSVSGSNEYVWAVPSSIPLASNYRVSVQLEKMSYITASGGWTYPKDESDGNISVTNTTSTTTASALDSFTSFFRGLFR
ncbi:MAG: peptidoglycan-binding protein [Candidatus Jorgensenbacteria bacterium]|nr:peptidoglycan-binding protein [Candidatus Jorgensenbacteria bacterium]